MASRGADFGLLAVMVWLIGGSRPQHSCMALTGCSASDVGGCRAWQFSLPHVIVSLAAGSSNSECWLGGFSSLAAAGRSILVGRYEAAALRSSRIGGSRPTQ